MFTIVASHLKAWHHMMAIQLLIKTSKNCTSKNYFLDSLGIVKKNGSYIFSFNFLGTFILSKDYTNQVPHKLTTPTVPALSTKMDVF